MELKGKTPSLKKTVERGVPGIRSMELKVVNV